VPRPGPGRPEPTKLGLDRFTLPVQGGRCPSTNRDAAAALAGGRRPPPATLRREGPRIDIPIPVRETKVFCHSGTEEGFQGPVLNQPVHLTGLGQAETNTSIAPSGKSPPLHVTEKYLRERGEWKIHPRKGRGLDELPDAPWCGLGASQGHLPGPEGARSRARGILHDLPRSPCRGASGRAPRDPGGEAVVAVLEIAWRTLGA
jgi:hypothetical protein